MHSRNGYALRVVGAVVVIGLVGSSTRATVIYGGPTYDSSTGTGYTTAGFTLNHTSSVGDGTAVGVASKSVNGTDVGFRGVRWDSSGNAVELGILGTDTSGYTLSEAYGVNPAGVAVGFAEKYSAGTDMGARAVRWNPGETAAIELGNVGTSSSGMTGSQAYSINAAGIVVGTAETFTNGTYYGTRAVRWNVSGNATAMGNIGTDANGYTGAEAYAVNLAGTSVGYAQKYIAGAYVGQRPVRWDASGAAAELGNLGVNTRGFTSDEALAVNAAGTAAGFAEKFTDDGDDIGMRAVRWDASGPAVTELDNLTYDNEHGASSQANAINNAGTVVGQSDEYSNGTFFGTRAVRWDASGTAVTELNRNGSTDCNAYDINSTGIAVGYAGDDAVAWGTDGLAIDLNSLLAPADRALWTLHVARNISDTNWITGAGTYDPDGNGPLPSYSRSFLIQLPEPGTLGILALSGIILPLRRRR